MGAVSEKTACRITGDVLNSILTEEEIEKLVLSLGDSRGGSDFSEADIMTVIHWAEEASIAWHLLQNVLEGTVKVDVKNGECVYMITEKGKKEVEKDLRNTQTDLLQ